MNINGGKPTVKLCALKLSEPRKALKPILPKLPSYVEPKRSYEIHSDELYNSYGTCYVCDALFYQGIRLWGVQTPRTGLATKIGQLLGDKYAVVVNADDVICQKCFSLLIHIDQLEEELKQVRQILRGYLINKYHIEDTPVEDTQEFQTEPSPPAPDKKRQIISKGAKPKPVQKCNMCGMQFDTLRALRKHNIKIHLATWTCHFCNEIFKEEKLFTDHTKSHLTENSLQMAVSLQQTIDHAQLQDLGNGLVNENLCSDDITTLTCNLCGVDFSQEDAFNEHMHTHQVLLDLESLDKPEALSLDGFGTNSESVDLMDMNIFDNADSVEHVVNRFICANCNLGHATQEEMTLHMQTVHHINPCYLCSDFFGTKGEIERHITETHANENDTTWLLASEKQTVACGFCETLLEGDEDLERHAQECQLKPNESAYTGEIESIEEAFEKEMPTENEENSEEAMEEFAGETQHLEVHDLVASKNKKGKKSQELTCIYCAEVFSDKKTLLEHELNNPSHLTMSCPDCDSSFARDKDLNDHRELVHPVIRCRWCPKTFKNVKQIKTHETRHVRSLFTVYDCDVCHRIFQTPTGLRHHMLSHTGEYKYTCEFCGKGFAAKARSEEHRASHTKEKRYTCEICGIKFSVQATYWIHRKWHDNPKPYQCGECGVRFKHSSLLSVHKRKHTGERPYACSYCEQTFSVSNSLKRHMSLHTGTFPYSCDSCNMGFPARHKYAQHMSRVHDDDTLLLEQINKKKRGLVMALKDPEKEAKPPPEETWVLADGMNESEHYLTLETEEGEKILLAGGSNQIEIVYQDEPNMEVRYEGNDILGNSTTYQD